VSDIKPPVCDYEGSDYQERFWDQGNRAYEDRVEAIALRRLLPNTGHRLLEIGAGAGRNTPRYDSFEQIILLDYARTQLEKAQERLGNSDRYCYVVADVYRMPFAPGIFDASTMIRTLHHMSKPLAALQQIRPILQPGACFILEYANKQNLKAIVRWLLRRQSWNPFNRQPIEFAKLNFDFHPAAVRAWLSQAGFDIQRQLTVSHFRIAALKRLVPLNLLVSLDSAAQLTGKWCQLSPSVFVLSKAVGENPPAPEGAFWRCPACGSLDLSSVTAGLHCGNCGRTWSLRNEIYDFKDPL
jgi:ubiquinone/menaquinone biosynthesis C-methylase UbiE